MLACMTKPMRTRFIPPTAAPETYGLPEKPDFHAQHFGKPAPYTKAGFVQDLKAVLDEIEPDSIITTALCDTHGDHSGLYQFICDELCSRREAGKKVPTLYTGIVHSPAGMKTGRCVTVFVR